MERGGLPWKKIGAAVLAAFVFQSSMYGMPMDASAQDLSASQDLLEYTAQELLTEDSDAAYAYLKIGDWLDYGDYGIEREDIPGTDYLFYLTTKNAQGDTINDEQLAYCVQSYFLTPADLKIFIKSFIMDMAAPDMTEQNLNRFWKKNIPIILQMYTAY